MLHRPVRLRAGDADAHSPASGSGKMMKHSGTHDLVEARLQFARPLERQLAHLKIVQLVFSFQVLGTAHARFAEIDTRDPRCRPAHRVLGRLGCPAPCNENGQVLAERSGRPGQVELRTAPLRIFPKPILFEVVDRRRIGTAFVKRAHLQRDTFRTPTLRCLLAHYACVARKGPMHGLDHAWVGYNKPRGTKRATRAFLSSGRTWRLNRGALPAPEPRRG